MKKIFEKHKIEFSIYIQKMSTTINGKIDELIKLLKDYANKNGEAEFETPKNPEKEKYSDIVQEVEGWFGLGNDILYKDIRAKYKANKMKQPTIKDINMAFVDSNNFCISNTGNKYKLIALNDNNRTEQRRAHWQLLDAVIKDRRGRGPDVDPSLIALVNNAKKGPKYKNVAKLVLPQNNTPKRPFTLPQIKELNPQPAPEPEPQQEIQQIDDERDPTNITGPDDMTVAQAANDDNYDANTSWLENGEINPWQPIYGDDDY